MSQPRLDTYADEVTRALEVHGRLRRRICADVRKRQLALAAEERERGATEPEAERRALERLGPPERLAEEYRERALSLQLATAAHGLMAAFIVLALGIVAVAWRVVEVRAYRFDGGVSVPVSDGVTATIYLLHHFSAVGLWIPAGTLAVPVAAALIAPVAALIAAELAVGLARRRRGAACLAVVVTGVALLIAVAAQIVFAARWFHAGQPHQTLLLLIVLAEAAAVLAALAVVAGLIGPFAPVRVAPLVRPRMAFIVGAALIAFPTVWLGLGIAHTCPWPGGCSWPGDPFFLISNSTTIQLGRGPVGARAVPALQGRKLAVAVEENRDQPKATVFRPATGPLEIDVWQAEWPLSQEGPCGRNARRIALANPLAPHRREECDVRDPFSDPGIDWRLVHRIPLTKPGPLALTYLRDGGLELAYYDRGAVRLAGATGWKSERVLNSKAAGLRLAPLGDGFALAALTGKKGSQRIQLLRFERGQWTKASLANVTAGFDLASSGNQIALLYHDARSRQPVFELRSPDLRVLAMRRLGRWTRVVLGTLEERRIAVGELEPLAEHEKLLTLLAVRDSRLRTVSRVELGRKNEILQRHQRRSADGRGDRCARELRRPRAATGACRDRFLRLRPTGRRSHRLAALHLRRRNRRHRPRRGLDGVRAAPLSTASSSAREGEKAGTQ